MKEVNSLIIMEYQGERIVSQDLQLNKLQALSSPQSQNKWPSELLFYPACLNPGNEMSKSIHSKNIGSKFAKTTGHNSLTSILSVIYDKSRQYGNISTGAPTHLKAK